VDIVIIRDDFQTLVNIVVANPIHTNLVQRVSMTTTHATTIAIQNKT
jgi:hypothetical protein